MSHTDFGILQKMVTAMFVKFRIPRSALLCTLFILLQSPAWDSPVLARQQAASPDSIFINVNNPFTEKFSIRGLTSTFPYPILTTISVLDEQGKHISGLADTLDWIGPEATANNGRPVRDIWTPLLEFYQSDSTLPPNPDLYRQIRDPLFTEIREVLEVPTSTMLVMDMSESMQTVIDSVRDALEAFVASMRDVDRGAVLQFSDNNKIHIIRPFMSDRHRLQNGVNSGIPKGRTALYDALGTAIQATSRETSVRRAIIAYTDGVDNHSLLYTPESVIDSANVHRIPIFMIALGDSLNIEPLIRIAEGTGGIFFQAAGPREMPGIYRQLSVLIKNYYVMAHQSSDSLYNNTERVVSVQVNTSAGSVRGRGTYRVPGPDLRLSLTATADTSVLVAGDRLAAAAPGDTVGLLLRWQNSGEYAADSLTIELQPAWPIAAIDSTRRPVRVDSLLRWRFAPLPVQGADSLFLSVIMPDTLAPDSLLQIFSAAITTRNEFPGANNFARDSLVILQNESPPDTSATPGKTDLAIFLSSQTDTTASRDGILRNAVFPGDTLSMQIELKNLGPNQADSVRISRNLPKHLQLISSDPVPEVIEKIQPDSSIVFTFSLHVRDSLAADITELVSTATLFAANDSLAANNSDSDTLFVLRKSTLPPDTTGGLVDLAIRQYVRTDSLSISGEDTTWFARAGEVVTFTLLVHNQSAVTAQEVLVEDFLPDSVFALGVTSWTLPQLPGGESRIFTLHGRLAQNMPSGVSVLINRCRVHASNEDSTKLQDNRSEVRFFHLGAQPAPAQILAEPEIVNVGAPVRVSVRSESETRWWDVHVVRADGSIDSSYADAFINATPLPVGEWLELQPDFTDTRMVSELEIEPLTFELHTIDLLGRREVARTIIRIRSNNDFALERNVFRPGVEQTVDITFKLSSNREATLDLYDVAGRHVTRLSKAPYQAGWNTFTWNGRTESGQPVGSGIYVVTIRSGDYHSWKKLIVVR